MNIIKEQCKGRCVLRGDTYAHRVSVVLELVEQANQDFFPTRIDYNKIDIKIYGGQQYKGTMGIEFDAPPHTEIPEDYTPIAELELTLS